MSDLVPYSARKQPEPDLESGYYACQIADDTFAVGDLVYLLEVKADRVEVVSGEHRYYIDRDDFVNSFTFDPDGLAHRQAQMAGLMGDIANMQATGARDVAAAAGINPHLGSAGELTGISYLEPAEEDDESIAPSAEDSASTSASDPASVTAPASASGPGSMPLAVGGTTALSAKKQLAAMRNSAARLRNELEARQGQLKAFAEEQAIILRAQVSALSAVLNKAEEAVWTINLYLGSNEQIEQLAAGEPAPADAPITVRQLVLFMDEECAAAAEEGGIDARSVERFDEWLTEDPAHLAQVLPEAKGMVALKPRRKSRDYNDPWMNKAMAEANKKTYFVLRNGDNLYRMWTDYEVDERLVPKTDEFLSLFTERKYNWETREDEVIQLSPGSEAFMDAEKRVDDRKRHYMRAALILQGLIDRTPIFYPLPVMPEVFDPQTASYQPGKIDVTKQEAYEAGAIQVILDADLMLSDGRERFVDWQKRINNELTVGMRVIGSFSNWEHGLRNFDFERRRGNSRISPASAGYPSSDELCTLEKRAGDGGEYGYSGRGKSAPGVGGAFVFYFKREGERWDPYDGYSEYQKRASCVVDSSDNFILNFDAASVEEMEFYLTSRLDRHNYLYLVPVLKRAIAMKRAEEEAEAPFRLLLVSQIMQKYGPGPSNGPEGTNGSVDNASASASAKKAGRKAASKSATGKNTSGVDSAGGKAPDADALDADTVAAAVPELVRWWKFKNRTHRALASDDAKALRMIVDEFGLRMTQEAERAKRAGELAQMKTMILAAEPTALLIAHKRGAEYVALVPANDENIFVHEQIWTAKGLKSARQWRTVDSRSMRWQVLHQSSQLDGWATGANRAEHLTDDERTRLIEDGWLALAERHAGRRSYSHSQNKAAPIPLAAAVAKNGDLELFYADGEASLPDKLLLSNKIAAPELGNATIIWRRDATRAPIVERLPERHISVGRSSFGSGPRSTSAKTMPWHITYEGKPFAGRVLWEDAKAIDAFVADLRAAEAIEASASALQARVREALQILEAQFVQAAEDEARAKFAADFGDPALWEGHLKTLKLPRNLPEYKDMSTALADMIERHESPAGMTAAEIIARGSELSGRQLKIDDAVRELSVSDGFSVEATAEED